MKNTIIKMFEDDYFKAIIIIIFGIWFLYIGTGYYWIRSMGINFCFIVSGFYLGKALSSSNVPKSSLK